MANATRTVKVRFDGTAAGLTAASKQAERDLERVRAKAASFRDGAISFGAITGLVGAVSSLGGPAVAGGVAALGALGFAGAAVGLAFSGTGDAVEAYNKALQDGDWSEYNKLLAKMPPSQREFTRELVKTKDEYGKLKKTAADSVLPGITNATKAARDLLPTLDAAVKRSGKVISDTGDDLADLFRSDEFKKDLDGYAQAVEPVERALGRFFVNTTADLVKFGASQKEASEGFADFVDSLSDGLGGFFEELAPYSADFKLVWQSLGDIIEEVLPVAGRFFGEAARTWGPVLRDVADWLGENRDEVRAWAGDIAAATPYLLGLALGLKGLKAAAAGLDLARAIGGAFGAAEKDAPGKGRRAGAAWRGGFVAAAGVLIGAEILGQLTPGEWNDKGASLGQQFGNGVADNARKLLSGDFLGIVDNYKTFWGQVAQDAVTTLSQITGIAAETTAEFNLSANPTAANGVISYTVSTANGQQGTMTLGANGEPALLTLNGVRYNVDSTTGRLTLAANQDPALGTLNGTRVTIDQTTGRMTIAGHNGEAIRTLGQTTGAVNGSRGSVSILGNAADAFAKLRAFLGAIPTFVSIGIRAVTGGAGGGPVGAVAGVRGYKRGGPIFGPGTGTSDSIPAVAGPRRVPIRVANNEHIVTEQEVMAVGGHAGVYRIRRAMLDGSLNGFLGAPGHAAGGPPGVALSSGVRAPGFLGEADQFVQAITRAADRARTVATAVTPQVDVKVYIDGQEFRGMVRAEIDSNGAGTRRLVASGSGRGW